MRHSVFAPEHPRGATNLFLVVAGAALLVRLVVFFQLRGSDFFHLLLGDSARYDQWAQSIASGDWMGSGVFYQSPLYPYTLAVLYGVFGHSLTLVRIVQIGADAVACGLTALGSRRLFGPLAGILTGFVMAIYGPSLFFDVTIQKSTLDLLLMSVLVFGVSRTRGPLAAAEWAIYGIVVGLLGLNRENALLLTPIVAVWCYVRSARRSLALAVALCGAALVLLPVGIRNLTVGGDFELTTSQFGPNLFIGNNDQANGTYVPLVPHHGSVDYEQRDATTIAEQSAGRTLTSGEVSTFWQRRAVGWIQSHPSRWLQLLGRKVVLFLNRTEAADTEDPYSYARESGALAACLTICNFGVLMPVAIMGAWLTRDRWRELWPLYGFALVYTIAVLPFYVLDRYRYPIVPVVALLTGPAITRFTASWKRASLRARCGTAALAVSVAILCNWPVLSRRDIEAVTSYNIAYGLQSSNDPKGAEARYREAIALHPSDPESHSNLGVLLAADGDGSGAAREYTTALTLDPHMVEPHIDLGVQQAKAGQYGQALDSLHAAVALDGGNSSAHYNLGLVLATLGRPAEAEQQFTATLRLDPSNAEACNNLGIVFAQQGQIDRAIAQFKAALVLKPGYKEAAANLARAESLK